MPHCYAFITLSCALSRVQGCVLLLSLAGFCFCSVSCLHVLLYQWSSSDCCVQPVLWSLDLSCYAPSGSCITCKPLSVSLCHFGGSAILVHPWLLCPRLPSCCPGIQLVCVVSTVFSQYQILSLCGSSVHSWWYVLFLPPFFRGGGHPGATVMVMLRNNQYYWGLRKTEVTKKLLVLILWGIS